MKSRLIWRKSWNNNNKDSFWIECTDQEVIDNILPLNPTQIFLKKLKKTQVFQRSTKMKMKEFSAISF